LTEPAGLLLISQLGMIGLAKQEDTYTIPELVQEMSPGVVSIAVVDRDGRILSRGSGFIAHESGLIVTAFHVIENARYAMVQTLDGEIYDRIEVVDYDRRRDVAVIRIRPFSTLRSLDLDQTDDLVIGEAAVAIGNPQGLDHTVSEGLISGYRQMTGYRLIQVTVPISPGSSGGPLFTLDGNVVGITNYQLVTDRTQNLNFAVPSAYIRTLLDSSSSAVPLEEFAASMERARALPAVSVDPGQTPNSNTWSVVHDHRSSTFLYGCEGEVSVTAEGFDYAASNSGHSFTAPWSLTFVSKKSNWGSSSPW